MPLNLLVKYSNHLELVHLSEKMKLDSLYGIFKRDIEDNNNFKFRSKQIWPMKKQGMESMQVLFDHLIKRTEEDSNGNKIGSRVFELDRAKRLHWIKNHIEERAEIVLFSYCDRIKGKDTIRTYIYDKIEEYIIVLEPQDTTNDYYLLTAYYLNESYGKKQIEKKFKNKLKDLY